MSLSSSDKKIYENAMKYEKEGILEFLGSDMEGSDLLIEIDTKEEEVVSEFQKLLRKGYKVNDIQKCVTKLANTFLKTVLFEGGFDEQVQSEDVFGLDHINFDWTKNMIKKAKDLEDAKNLEDAEKKVAWEYSYKKAVESGVDIIELDESIKALIAKHLRDMKGTKRKEKRMKKKSSKKKSSKKKSSKKKSSKKGKRSK
jgi:phage tail tube protein FII